MAENCKNKKSQNNYMIKPNQIRRIHTLIHILGIDDDLYRELLITSFAVGSSKNLTEAEADVLIDSLQYQINLGNRNYKTRFNEFYNRAEYMATPPQMRKVEAIWKDITHHTDRIVFKKTLRAFLQKRFGISDIRFMTKEDARAIIPVLEIIKNYKKVGKGEKPDSTNKKEKNHEPNKNDATKQNYVSLNDDESGN